MEFPMDIQRLIYEFARPIHVTKKDWRKGSYIHRNRDYCGCYHEECGHNLRNRILRKIKYSSCFWKNMTDKIIIPINELNCQYPNFYLVDEERYQEWCNEMRNYA